MTPLESSEFRMMIVSDAPSCSVTSDWLIVILMTLEMSFMQLDRERL